MIFRQMYDSETSTYTYLLADETTKEAILIDSVLEQVERDLKVLKELDLNLKYLMETHVHADHITGITKMKAFFPQAKSVLFNDSGNISADLYSYDNQEFDFGNHKIKVLSTPGHTNGCVSYYIEGMVFTGDALLIRGTGRTDFQQGSPEKLYNSITNRLFTLPDETIVYPGHDYKGMESSTIAEEKQFNPRLAGKTKEDFIEIMNNLNLPYPKKIQASVPANIVSGDMNYDGRIKTVSVTEALELHNNNPHFIFIDVREPFEWEQGVIPNIKKISLGNLPNELDSLDKNENYIMVCRSGGRSGKATSILMEAGFKNVYNMAGGMIDWNNHEYITEV
ncbi:MAG: MBL fold metallo-hydrolase [Candidatus Sericytochromatia bacterium]